METCPKCNGRTDTYRHPNAKIWCTKCGFVVREENGPMWWEKKIERYKDAVYVRYQDDGPLGVCGQITSETSPWDRLYIFKNYDDAMGFIRKVEDQRDRRNARFTRMWQAGEDFTEVFDCTKHGEK